MHGMHHRGQSRGFTLVEVLVAATISVVVITGAFSTFIYGLRSWQAEAVKNEINIDLEGAMERIRHDLRLSSVGKDKMSFYPANASEYTAISFPISTPGTNGLLQRDDAGNIKWTQTVIYHVLPGYPDKFQRTVFSPRSTNDSARYSQLQSVVQGTNLCLPLGIGLGNENCTTQVFFRNLVKLRIRPPEIKFDGYAPAYSKAQTFNWGSAVLSNGAHNLKFTIEGRNTNSTGYKVGVDQFSLSPSASPREGEIYLPANTHPHSPFYTYSLSGGSVSAQDMSSNMGSWSGNCQLTYNGAAVSNSITFVVPNDLWCDANFDNPPGVINSNVSRKTDGSFTFIPDIVISMDKGTNWTAAGCTDGTIGSIAVSNTIPAVVNIIYGGANPAAAIYMNGEWVRVLFAAGTNGNLFIKNATISRQLSGITPVPGTTAKLYFDGGSPSKKIRPGTSINSDWVKNYVIDRMNNYLVQFELQPNNINETFNNARAWVNSTVPFMSAMNGVPTNIIVGVSALEVRYPSNGLYRSGIFDTHIADPVYRTLHWTEGRPYPDADINVRVRSGHSADLSDAGAWLPMTAAGYFPNNTDNDISGLQHGRYVQYEALFSASGDHMNTAVLRDVTIDWDVPTGLVDLQVDFGKGPDYGIVSATVDGQSFVKGLEIEMEIFKKGPFETNTAVGIMEIRPKNTNK